MANSIGYRAPAQYQSSPSIDPNQWPGLIISLSTTGVTMEGALLRLNKIEQKEYGSSKVIN